MEAILFAMHLMSTTVMTGIIWFMQIGHYPMLRYVGRDAYTSYEQQHVKRVMVPAVLMLMLELLTGLALLFVPFSQASRFTSSAPFWLTFSLLIPIWISTWLIQVPAHKSLEKKFDLQVHSWLVNSNWVRTIAWTLRSAILYSLFIALL
jgi:hypothetical protein